MTMRKLLFEQLRKLRLKHPEIYLKLKCMKDFHTPEFKKLLCGYFLANDRVVSLVIEHLGERHPDEIIYLLSLGEQKPLASGLFALLRGQLEQLMVAEKLGFVPVIKWGKGIICYDKEMPDSITNVFEYYFKPVSHIAEEEVLDCRNVIRARENLAIFYLDHAVGSGSSYNITEKGIMEIGAAYKKYIHLNEKTQEYIEHELSRTLNMGKTLGVHVRGTDFKLGLLNHPKVISPEDYLEKTKEVYINKKYDKVFLATDDIQALNLFRREFGENLLYYEDTKRSEGNIGAHGTVDSRPLHHYKLGLEVLRDAYTLASCDGLIAGKSQVSFGARYISIALNNRFKDLVVLDHGLNS